ncbi:hypothetical protein GRJ2_003435600 [Grus japonensis]|uniref:Uncharacterized protein n=1 Tax=Grus japonensis TaxID=30415 RepID=A0ABC9YHY9_GRUJA
MLGIDYLQRGYFKDPKGYRWAFGIAALEMEEIEPLSSLPGLSEDPSVLGLLRVKEQQVPIATTTVHRQQYHTNRDSLVPIHKLIRQLEGQGVISRTHSPFNSPIWPVRKCNGEWKPPRSKVNGPAQEIQFLGIRWQDRRHQIPMDVISKIAAMSPPTNKKETQAFLGVVGFWRIHISNYSPIVSPLCHITRKKNDFKWGPEQ